VPTAVQNVGETHEMPAKTVRSAQPGLGADWAVHDLPSQRSTSTPGWSNSVLAAPTAVHADTDGHESASIPARGEARSMDHRLPFHRSAKGRAPEITPEPTATQADRDEQDTTRSDPPPAGVGVGFCTQRLPVHRAAAVRPLRVGPLRLPTMTHADPATHETPSGVHDAGPGCADHVDAAAAAGLTALHSVAAAQAIAVNHPPRSEQTGKHRHLRLRVRATSLQMPPLANRTPCLHGEIHRDRHTPRREIKRQRSGAPTPTASPAASAGD
jgi:hypothetical protein